MLGQLSARHNVTTWGIIGVVILQALTLQPRLLSFIIFFLTCCLSVLIRNLARLEGASGVSVNFWRSTLLATVIMLALGSFMFFGFRYVAI